MKMLTRRGVLLQGMGQKRLAEPACDGEMPASCGDCGKGWRDKR